MIILTIILLALMEISLSFDNAVLNAKVLQTMDAKWQRRFILWGMPIAVFGMRLVFPIVIVAIATGLGLYDVLQLALNKPEEYAQHLADSHIGIAAFGGFFLLMIFLKFLFDSTREVHWIRLLEERLAMLGKMQAIEISVVLGLLLGLQSFLPMAEKSIFLLSGIAGILTYVFIDGIMDFLGADHTNIPKAGLASFIYLEILDASCSLDGVIGAFVLTNNIILIMIGLGIGAFAIRSLTLYLVKGATLKEYIYLEHGANYGIGSLSIIMLTSIFYAVPEPVTGMIGMALIGLSLMSSVKFNREKVKWI